MNITLEPASQTSIHSLTNLQINLQKHLIHNHCLRPINGQKVPVPSVPVPLFVEYRDYLEICRIAEIVMKVCIKYLPSLLENHVLQYQAGYTEIDIELAKMDFNVGRIVPLIARVDMTLDSGNINILEVNTDSPAGMFHYDMITDFYINNASRYGINSISNIDSFTNTSEKLSFNLMKRWNDWNTNHSHALKNISLIEWDSKHSTAGSEHLFFSKLLSKNGINAFVSDPAELRYKKDKLYNRNNGNIIDLIYKRALWDSLISKRNHMGTNALIEAYKSGNVCIENSSAARLIGNKIMLALLKSNNVSADNQGNEIMFDTDESNVINRNVPDTFIWGIDKNVLNIINSNPESYVIKSCGGFASKEVIFVSKSNSGISKTSGAWGKPYVAQKLVPHGVLNIPIFEDNIKWRSMYYTLGAYLIDGKCVGIDAKLREMLPITMSIPEYGKPIKTYRTSVIPLSQG